MLQYECCKSMLTANIRSLYTVVCYIGTMFMQVEQGTKQPEAGPEHKFSQSFTVVIGYPRNYQIRVIKLIRGSKIRKYNTASIAIIW